MRLLALALVAAAASCGSTLGDPGAPGPTTTTPLPEWTDADCTMFEPTTCRLDVAKASVGIDVHYPNTFFCGLQVRPTTELPASASPARLAAAWQVSMGYGVNNQTLLTPAALEGGLEYRLGTERLYLTRVTFLSKSSDTLATVVARAFGPGVSVDAVPIMCPGR
jgi:hypothetical protein